MAAILRKLPFYDRFTTIQVRERAYRVFSYQILLWVSVGRAGEQSLAPGTPRFPVVLDPAFTDNFLIHEQQLREFTGLEPAHLTRFSEDLRAHGRRIPLHGASLWLHRNEADERDRFADAPPFRLELHRGIGICRDADLYPRLALLGARALRQARARLIIDYARCRASLRTPSRFWFFNWW
jgi:hypothetical protein